MDERLNNAPCGYISITQQGYITKVNQTFLDWMEYDSADLLTKHIESIMSTANKLVFHSYFYPNINLHGHVEELFIRLKHKSGETVPYLLNGRRFDQAGVEMIDCILVQMRKRIEYEQELRSAKKQIEDAYWENDRALEKLKDIHQEIETKQTELLRMNAVLVELSNTDKLTGLRNRRFMQEKLEELIAGFTPTGDAFSLLILDIDHFKKINDTYGHQTGDRVLEQLADILKANAGVKDIACRYGGEEFVVILPGTNALESKITAENLRRTIASSIWETGCVTVSIGIATCTPADSAESILKNADRALYASKESGRNRVTHSRDGKL
ncbi:sensor domain-containing diguanylate cyclase [Paenibacillus nasutitermitis]|uniref:GGDEF domain-containing protein n=1 Tax=Paenibacillus nasutitermitis TaxID=1652958 RepID=A0A917DY99_9BACL|nr:sensor domain-containing diguanylate cyclase [Paenibacillus nasutitermitis]GGD78183.1 hypothetical protein GCM10010911_40250 [Paenibacillus nasutitermitis]